MKFSKIEWTDHTFNPWEGCTKISPGCANCYAEILSKRWGKNCWGDDGERVVRSDSYWKQPLKWNEDARKSGQPALVFAGSMCDIGEDNGDIAGARLRLRSLISQTPNLIWLLLTKRPENIVKMFPLRLSDDYKNVWFGTSVENQKYYDIRVPHLLNARDKLRPSGIFLSVEPMLGRIILGLDFLTLEDNWVIVGGESQRGARPMHEDWAISVRNQCEGWKVPFFFKQWGGVNKKSAGRLLHGVEHNEFPAAFRRGDNL